MWGVLSGGQKVYVEKVCVLFRSPKRAEKRGEGVASKGATNRKRTRENRSAHPCLGAETIKNRDGRKGMGQKMS